MIVLPGEWDPLRRMVTPLRDPGMFLGRSAITSITGQSLVMASDQGVKPADPGEAVSSNQPVHDEPGVPTTESTPPRATSRESAPPKTGASVPVTGLSEPHLLDRLAVLYKYRWLAATVFVLIVGWFMVDSYTKIPRYRATARILIEDQGSDSAATSDLMRGTAAYQDPEIYMQTQLRIMRGRDLAQRVAQKVNAQSVPELNGQGPKPTQLAKAIAIVKFYATWPYRFATSSAAPPPLVPSTTPGDAGSYGDAMLGSLMVNQVRGSQLVDLCVRLLRCGVCGPCRQCVCRGVRRGEPGAQGAVH